MSTDWMADGKCRDMPPTVFFPSDGLGVQAPNESATTALSPKNAWSMRSSTASTTASGVVAPSVSVDGSCDGVAWSSRSALGATEFSADRFAVSGSLTTPYAAPEHAPAELAATDRAPAGVRRQRQ